MHNNLKFVLKLPMQHRGSTSSTTSRRLRSNPWKGTVMTNVHAPSGTNRPGKSRWRLLYFWGPVVLSALILFVSWYAISAVKTSSLQGTPPAVTANAGNAAPSAAAIPEPAAVPTPAQTAPLAPPVGLSAAEALDWRLVQWDKFTDDGHNELVGMPQLNMPTEGWAAIVNQWIYRLPHDTGALSTQFQGHPWAADGVTTSSDSVFYPRFANGEMIATKIGEGNSNDPPGTAVRFFYTNIFLPGSSTAELRTLKFVWHESSDHVGHVLVSLCEVKDALRC